MSNWLSNVGKTIKRAVVDTGHFAGKVASNPIVDGVIGATLGPGAAAAASGLGHLLAPGGNLGKAAVGTATGYGAGLAGGAVRKLGTGALAAGAGLLGRGGDPSLPAPVNLPTFTLDANGNVVIDPSSQGADPSFGGLFPAGGAPDAGGGSWLDALKGGVGGVARKLGSGIGGVGAGDLAIGGLAGYQALAAANASKRAGALSDKALNLADTRWADAAPLRTAGQARLLNPTRPNLSSVYTDPTNVFARKMRNA